MEQTKVSKEQALQAICEKVFVSNAVLMTKENIIKELLKMYQSAGMTPDRAENGLKLMIDAGFVMQEQNEYCLNPKIFTD